MSRADEATGLRNRRALALAGLTIWIATLALLSGPARWEIAHTYAHWIDGAEESLPLLTDTVALPVLGLAETNPLSLTVRLLFWGSVWLGALALLRLVWKAQTREHLVEVLVLVAAIYVPLLILLLSVFAVSLWLPFSLM
jgi:hypothetical protein